MARTHPEKAIWLLLYVFGTSWADDTRVSRGGGLGDEPHYHSWQEVSEMFTSPVGAAWKVTPGPHALSGDEADGGYRCHKALGQDTPPTPDKE